MIKLMICFILLNCSLFSQWEVFDASDFDESVGLLYGHYTFHLDKDDNFWVGINNGVSNPYGVMKISEDSYEVFTSENTIIPNIPISCITQGPNGDMYIGTYEDTRTIAPNEKQTCVIRFDGENWEYFNQHNSPMHPYDIRDILVTGDDEFWVATVIGLFHYKESTWKSYFEDENDFRREIRRPAIDKYNNLYITNILRELYSTNLNNQNIKFNKLNTPNIPASTLVSPSVDSINNIWLHYKNNLAKKTGNNWIVYDSIFFSMNTPSTIYISRQGKTYTNTHEAVYEYKDNSNWEKILDIPDSILGVSLRGVDSKGIFWFAGGNSLIKYTPETNSIEKEINVNIYPNPSQNSITINTDVSITNLELYSLNLSKILEYTANHTTKQEIDISNLSSGTYFIKINDKFVKFVRE